MIWDSGYSGIKMLPAVLTSPMGPEAPTAKGKEKQWRIPYDMGPLSSTCEIQIKLFDSGFSLVHAPAVSANLGVNLGMEDLSPSLPL